MNTCSIRSWLVLGILAGIAASGCGRNEPLKFRVSDRVKELAPELQRAVARELVKYCGTPQEPKLLSDENISSDHLKFGAQIYNYRCAQCHGVTGDGAGPAAPFFAPLPRDYRRGIFKFTSTPYGSIPRREDLKRTVRRGVPGTAMPSFDLLSDREIDAVVDYVLVLTQRGELETALAIEAESEEELDPDVVEELVQAVRDRWDFSRVQIVHPLTPMPPITDETIAAGKETFLKRECFKCHGKDGRGGTVGGVEVGVDAWGHKTAAADLTSGMLHGGNRPIDVYRRIYSGINGTPMPAFKDVLGKEPETIWHLVHFILFLSDQRRRGVWFDGNSTASAPVEASPQSSTVSRRAKSPRQKPPSNG